MIQLKQYRNIFGLTVIFFISTAVFSSFGADIPSEEKEKRFNTYGKTLHELNLSEDKLPEIIQLARENNSDALYIVGMIFLKGINHRDKRKMLNIVMKELWKTDHLELDIYEPEQVVEIERSVLKTFHNKKKLVALHPYQAVQATFELFKKATEAEAHKDTQFMY